MQGSQPHLPPGHSPGEDSEPPACQSHPLLCTAGLRAGSSQHWVVPTWETHGSAAHGTQTCDKVVLVTFGEVSRTVSSSK